MLDDGMPSIINHHLPESPEGKQMGGVNLRVHPELCRKLSVECNIDEDTELPPVLMFHGTKDRTINLVKDAIMHLPQLGNKGSFLIQKMNDKLVEHKQYIAEYGQDLEEIRNWEWHK